MAARAALTQSDQPPRRSAHASPMRRAWQRQEGCDFIEVVRIGLPPVTLHETDRRAVAADDKNFRRLSAIDVAAVISLNPVQRRVIGPPARDMQQGERATAQRKVAAR